ncbi:MAG: hypothetical protein AAF587_25800 [Bacteroidota bacterium]
MNSAEPFLPLIEFFHQLRSRGFELGIGEYQLLLDALETGSWIPPSEEGSGDWKQAMFRLCCTLWYKPNQSLKIFTELFEDSWQKHLRTRKRMRKRSRAHPTEKQEDSSARDRATPSEESRSIDLPTPDEPNEKEEAVRNNQTEPLKDTRSPSSRKKLEEIFVSYESTKTRNGVPDEGHLLEQERLASNNFLFTGAYLPISKREMKLNWRYLRTQQQVAPSDELHVPKMVDRLARIGHVEPVYKRETTYRSQLMILIDVHESMSAFGEFAHTLADFAVKGKFKKVPSVYYFNEIPEKHLYTNIQQTEAIQVQELIDRFNRRKVDLLIISDAGAAKGRYSEERVLRTRRAIRKLQGYANKIVWINPMPEHRWYDSSADYIADLIVPMFEASNIGLMRAIDVLRGKHQLEDV